VKLPKINNKISKISLDFSDQAGTITHPSTPLRTPRPLLLRSSQVTTLHADNTNQTSEVFGNLGDTVVKVKSFLLRTAAPVLTVSAPADNLKTAQSQVTVSGTISETATVTITVNSGTAQTAAITGSA